ncbi:hypothetical protein M9458_041957, partial [Cirrhinus mrigala]
MEKSTFSFGSTEQEEDGESAVQRVNCSSASGPDVSHTSHNRLPSPEGSYEHSRLPCTVHDDTVLSSIT